MTKQQQITELKRMVNRTINGFKGNDLVTKEVNLCLSKAYTGLSLAFNVAHGWKLKKARK